MKYFEDAVAWRPDFATAHATLARAQLQLLYDGPLSPREVVPKAESAARTAVDLDDTVAAAHQVLGVILHLYYWRWEEGRKEFRRARDLETRVVDKQRRSAFRLIRGGRFGEGAVEIERARQTNPLSPEPFISAADLYQRAGQHDRAVAAFQQAADIAPRLARPRFLLGRLFLQMGKVDDAIENLEAAVRLSEINPRFYACLGVAYAAGGRTAEARRLVSELEERARREYVSAFGIALIYDALGEKSAALSAFDRAYEDRAIELAQMADYPPFRTIASEPIFQSRIQTIGRRPGNLTMAIDSRR